MARRRVLILYAFAGALIAGATAARGATVKVTASGTGMDSRFTPAVVVIAPGDTVEWDNVQGTHNVVSDDDLFLSGSVAPAPWVFSHTFDATGAYRYYCSSHGNIGGVGQSGVVIVRPPHPANDIVDEKSAFDFAPVRSTVGTDVGPEVLMRHGTNTDPTELVAGVTLPSGAKIAGLEVSGCDDSDTSDLTATLLECPDPKGACAPIAQVVTNGTPGCDFFATTLADGPNINNLGNSYVLDVLLGPDSKLRFRDVRVFYRRVLSPAPATATFADVPTNDLAFRAVEALAASGITQGCGIGQFCPNQTVTRSQMAIFLARALGLFWAN